MTYEERIQNVSVIGAAGKMGSGILLLTALEMTDLSLLPENKEKTFVLNAIDVSPEGLSGLMKYLREQVRKTAEKKIVWLRKMYATRDDLVENYDIINEYIFDALNIVRPVSTNSAAYASNIIFEAVSEKWELKLLKEVYGCEEMQMLPHFNREQFRDKIPEEYSSDEKSITRLFVRLQQWGFMKKVGHNQYQFAKDELDEIMS